MSQTNQKHSPEAEALADAILTAAGSGLRHYMPSTRERIISSCQSGLVAAESRLLKVIEDIAVMPLWGEPIEDARTRSDYTESGEYDAADNQFTPSCDTESTMLREAVELAREARAKAAGKEIA